MRKKEELAKSTDKKEIKIFEDLSPARSMFLKMMKSDSRILSVWTKDGIILYTFHNNPNVNKITNLYVGGIYLDYSLNDGKSCFRR